MVRPQLPVGLRPVLEFRGDLDQLLDNIFPNNEHFDDILLVNYLHFLNSKRHELNILRYHVKQLSNLKDDLRLDVLRSHSNGDFDRHAGEWGK